MKERGSENTESECVCVCVGEVTAGGHSFSLGHTCLLEGGEGEGPGLVDEGVWGACFFC